MVFSVKSCYLQCVKNSTKRINLPHQEPVIIGRNEETAIQDLQVSRKHLECTADYENEKVIVKTIGKTYSGCNGFALLKGETYQFKHGDTIEIRLGEHEYDIIFEPDTSGSENKAKRTKLDSFFNLTGNSVKMSFCNSGKWEEVDERKLLIYTNDNCVPQKAIASFDLDGTLIKTKSGAKYPKADDDWTININSIPGKLQQLHETNHKIVIFTNQLGLGNDPSKIKGFKEKIEKIIAKLAVPIQVFIAITKSIYRKPAPGMWNTLKLYKNENVEIDLSKSFFVGDAAGRNVGGSSKKSKDHSICDRLYALNIGLKFYTPEEFFLKQSQQSFEMPEFDPKNLQDISYPDFSSTSAEVVIMVGGPATGKSYFCKNHLIAKGYIHVSRDDVGKWQTCAKLLDENLKKGKSVVIDNTNPDKESRKRFIEIAKKHGIPCRCFLMLTTFKHSEHNNKFREMTDSIHSTVGDLVFRSYRKSFQEPELSEGFTDIVKIPFIPKFNDPEQEKLYKMFLLEK